MISSISPFDPSRRTLLAGAGALGLASTIGLPSGIMPANAQGATVSQAPGFYRYKVGDITVTAINDGFAMRPIEGFIRNAEIADVQTALLCRSLSPRLSSSLAAS
jgi:hypothetical protein